MSPPAPTRRPRYVPFLVTGAVIGIVVAVVLTLTVGSSVSGQRRLAFYLCILLGGFGTLAGGGLAVWLERGDADRHVD